MDFQIFQTLSWIETSHLFKDHKRSNWRMNGLMKSTVFWSSPIPESHAELFIIFFVTKAAAEPPSSAFATFDDDDDDGSGTSEREVWPNPAAGSPVSCLQLLSSSTPCSALARGFFCSGGLVFEVCWFISFLRGSPNKIEGFSSTWSGYGTMWSSLSPAPPHMMSVNWNSTE